MEEKTVKHISSLFLKQFTGEISEEERKELDAWVQTNPENLACKRFGAGLGGSGEKNG